MERAMRPDRRTLLRIAFALMACIASAVLLADRHGRTFERPPAIPYYDLAESRWHYRLLAPLSAPHDRLAIWGWAAHDWIYSKLLPATRESSTEFALKNWGPDGYYRKRYLGALQADPPEFFIEAVGPGQFLFTSRAEFGMQVVPEVQDFVGRGYRLLLDDGSTAVWIRADRFDACCSVATAAWRVEDGQEARTRAAPPLPAMAQMRWSDIPGAGRGTLSQALPAMRGGSRVVVPFVLRRGARNGAIRLEGPDGTAECAATPAPESALNVCIFDVPADGDWTLRASGPMSVGQPLLLAATPDGVAR
jgi:hypothetical protein